MQARQTLRFVALTAFFTAVMPAAAEDSPLAPADAVADRINPTGVTGVYRCAVGDAATVRFSFTGFDDGQHRIEESLGGRAASFAPSGIGEVMIVQIEEQRTRYEDAQQNSLALSEAALGFDVTEVATVSCAPKLGLALRIERKRDGRVIEASSLAEYKRG